MRWKWKKEGRDLNSLLGKELSTVRRLTVDRYMQWWRIINRVLNEWVHFSALRLQIILLSTPIVRFWKSLYAICTVVWPGWWMHYTNLCQYMTSKLKWDSVRLSKQAGFCRILCYAYMTRNQIGAIALWVRLMLKCFWLQPGPKCIARNMMQVSICNVSNSLLLKCFVFKTTYP